MVAYVLAFAAGSLTSLSPCVLPVLPIVVGGAAQRHALGPVAIAGGMVAAFTGLGLTLATAGTVLGVPDTVLRSGAAWLMILSGVVLWSARLQSLVGLAFVAPAGRAAGWIRSPRLSGLPGQFVLGALLGVVWSPCTGPTLGAAVALAAQADGRLRAAGLMLIFGVGAALPLLGVAYLARTALTRGAGLQRSVARGKRVLGALLAAIGLAILFGVDKAVEARLLDALPGWWVDSITRI